MANQLFKIEITKTDENWIASLQEYQEGTKMYEDIKTVEDEHFMGMIGKMSDENFVRTLNENKYD